MRPGRPFIFLAASFGAIGVGACSSPATKGDPIAFREMAVGRAGLMSSEPEVCSRKAAGTVFQVEGFAHWRQEGELCSGDVCTVELFQVNKPDGSPLRRPDLPLEQQAGYEGYVRVLVNMKGIVGGFIEKPRLENPRWAGKNLTVGEVAKDSLALHLSDRSLVNNRTRIRAFIKVSDVNGACDVRYVGGERI
ncbi:MAG: hypothetical protein KF795_03140 [Labilithrix sp.]|nr:hypothetical protein [Labilithrix sp.]